MLPPRLMFQGSFQLKGAYASLHGLYMDFSQNDLSIHVRNILLKENQPPDMLYIYLFCP